MILGIETTTKIGSLAIVENGKIIIEDTIDTKLNHAASLVSVLNKLLKKVNLNITDIKGIAVDTGPGSFTGIRVGIATSYGLAEVENKFLISICSLKVLAYEIANEKFLKKEIGRIVPFIDAKRGRVYTGFYKKSDGNISVEKEPYLTTLNELVKNIHPEDIILSPDIKRIDLGVLDKIKDRLVVKPIFPRASTVALLAEKKNKNGYVEKHIEPMYLYDVEYKTINSRK